MTQIELLGQKSKNAAKILSSAGKLKDHALLSIADSLILNCDKILKANLLDLDHGKNAGLSDSLLDRLALTKDRIVDITNSIKEIVAYKDPIGKTIDGHIAENGLDIKKVCVPLGVIGIIYEARPNVTVDAAALCLKSGNSVILRGGKEAINTNICLVNIMRTAINKAGLPIDSILLIEDTSRQSAIELMNLSKYLDVLIPRGGAGLIRSVVENAKVPVIETGVGNCHIYVDNYVNIEMAADIIFNAKTSRPSVCNATETILVHRDIASFALPIIKEKLDLKNVELRGCPITKKILGEDVVDATETDWETEYLDYILAVKVVSSLDDAVEHIAKYSSGHSEAIITTNYNNAQKFTKLVDSAAVYVNASTRFTDGGQFGLGAEIGISTQKLHARGPMGINELTSVKFVVMGGGHIR